MSRRPLLLADILGNAEHNGLYRLPEGLAPAGAIPIPGRRLTGKSAMIEAVAKALAFPDYFGFNWDALEECLADLSWHPGGLALLIDAADTPEDRAPEEWGLLLDILSDSARHWHAEGRPFAVFLQGSHAAYPKVTA
jgi:hypothetical protein